MSTLQLEAAPARSSPPLPVVVDLFRRLADADVAYCHWKSNEHLGPGTVGETDLDILVPRDSGTLVAQVLADAGFKRMAAVVSRSYVGVEDYLGLDYATGNVVHLHLHYRLILGEKFLKGYRLPWEGLFLDDRRLDPETGIYVSAPELELIVLLVRAALKLRRREAFGFRGPGPLDADFRREFRWLVERADPERLRLRATELLGPHGSTLLSNMLSGEPDRAGLVRFRAAIAPATDDFRTYSPAEATRRRWGREWRARWARLMSRIFRRHQPTRFTDPRGGAIIAFLGADGSGKSTVTSTIATWLSWRMEVVRLYFGFGDGPVSPVRRPLQTLKSLYSRRLRSRGEPGADPETAPLREDRALSASWRALPKAVWRVLWSWSVVREKQARLRQAQRGRNLGSVVICDRYPQAQIMALGDGPLLSHWQRHPWAWLRAAARWELAAYRRMEAVVPDLVIKLQVSPEVSAGRKRDVSLESLARRVEVVNRVQFPPGVRLVQIDANQPIEQVLLQVKRAVWEAL